MSLLVGSTASTVTIFQTWIPQESQTNEYNLSKLEESTLNTLISVAELIYPSEVTGIEEFVSSYVSGLSDSRKKEVSSAVKILESYTLRTHGTNFSDLSINERDSVLHSMGVDRTGSSPDGSRPERVRYYVVNQLLYGFYTSPTGGSLFGIENPVGHPGGYKSYQDGPNSENVHNTYVPSLNNG